MHPPYLGIGLGYSSFYGGLQSGLFVHEKRDITTLGKQYLFLHNYNSLVKHQIEKLVGYFFLLRKYPDTLPTTPPNICVRFDLSDFAEVTTPFISVINKSVVIKIFIVLVCEQ